MLGGTLDHGMGGVFRQSSLDMSLSHPQGAIMQKQRPTCIVRSHNGLGNDINTWCGKRVTRADPDGRVCLEVGYFFKIYEPHFCPECTEICKPLYGMMLMRRGPKPT